MGSGFNGQSFAFNGYLPIEQEERIKALKKLEWKVYNEDQTQIFMETPYRNGKMIADILKACKPQTRLCIASGLTTPYEYIRTLTIKQWKEQIPELGKVPSIFLIYK
jgi:16S rRNA (cytidine1402-2'-O)-methyltransferase